MGILITFVAGLIIWIVLWSIGAKGFDAFLITILMVVIAMAVRLVSAALPGKESEES